MHDLTDLALTSQETLRRRSGKQSAFVLTILHTYIHTYIMLRVAAYYVKPGDTYSNQSVLID
jgi:hypothetical protein